LESAADDAEHREPLAIELELLANYVKRTREKSFPQPLTYDSDKGLRSGSGLGRSQQSAD
jgi:hypothetical protein